MNMQTLLFGYFPYLVAIVFAFVSIIKLRRDLQSWRTGTAPLCHIHRLSPLSKAFHVSMLVLLVGHVFGMLVPFGLYGALGVTAAGKQMFAVITGGGFGFLCLAGLIWYLHRRLTDPEKRATGTRMDLFVLVFIITELLLGLMTIPVSLAHADGAQMLLVSQWARGIAGFNPGAAELLGEVSWIVKLHVLVGISFFLLIPFSHLVHMWTVPLRYLLYPEQVVTER